MITRHNHVPANLAIHVYRLGKEMLQTWQDGCTDLVRGLYRLGRDPVQTWLYMRTDLETGCIAGHSTLFRE